MRGSLLVASGFSRQSAALLAVIFLSAISLSAQAPSPGATLDPSTFRYARVIAPGPEALVILPLDAAVLAHSRGPRYRFADLRIVDDRNRQLPYLLDAETSPRESAIAFRTVAPHIESLRSTDGHQRTTYVVTLPSAPLPDGGLVLETGARTFRRDVQLSAERPADRRHRAPWAEVISVSSWSHADESVAAPPLVLGLGNRDATTLLITIDEGNNAPLALSAMRLRIPNWRIRFYRPAETPLRVLYGNREAVAPEYDLALLRTTVMGESAGEATMEAEPPAKDEPAAIVSPRVFWGFLIAAVVVLIGLIARLAISRSSEDPPPPSAPRP
jgi:hypothetical protein